MVWYNKSYYLGNPQIELIEGTIVYRRNHYNLGNEKEHEYDEHELEIIKQKIWELNNKNEVISGNELLAINIPNKIAINEFLNMVNIYFSYIQQIRVLKSSIPNIYNIYLQFKNREYSNIFYNTFNYVKFNPIEKEYIILCEVEELKIDEIYTNKEFTKYNKSISSPLFSTIKSTTQIETPHADLSSNANIPEEASCPICLEPLDIIISNVTVNYQNSANGILHVLCGHIFHIDCCLKFDDDICPLCRYHISPQNVSTCSLCTCENDLWICLLCGAINCGSEPMSNNHRKEHYVNTGHIYAKGLGERHSITFDFSRDSNLNSWFQNTIMSEFRTSDTDIVKDPKEKVEYIVGEYNSIISCQLESQRNYYINQIRKQEEAFRSESRKHNEDIRALTKELEQVEMENMELEARKLAILEDVKKRDNELKEVEKLKEKSEAEYNQLIKMKDRVEKYTNNVNDQISNSLKDLDEQILELDSQIKETKLHLNTITNNQIKGGSFTVLDLDSGKKKKGKK
jgi:BRCA1-associated protein